MQGPDSAGPWTLWEGGDDGLNLSRGLEDAVPSLTPPSLNGIILLHTPRACRALPGCRAFAQAVLSLLSASSVPYMDLCKVPLKGLFLYKPSTTPRLNQSISSYAMHLLLVIETLWRGGCLPKLISDFLQNHPSRWQPSSRVQAMWPCALGIADQVRRGRWNQVSPLTQKPRLRHASRSCHVLYLGGHLNLGSMG